MKYYIGVDGGGTKTEITLFDENKTILDSVKVAGSNHENLSGSFREAADIIMSGINLLLQSNHLTCEDITEILMGLAGIDHPYQHDALCEVLSERGLRNFRLYNDGFIITKAGLPDGVGIGYNCGTGTCCNSIDSRGNMLQIGGFSEISDDRGNGHWIALRVFNKIYDDICLDLCKTSMTERFCKKAELSPTREDLLSTIVHFEQEDTAEDFIRFLIDIFFESLNEGDAAAEEICEEMASRGADYICAHVKKQQFDSDTVPVVLSGSMHTRLPSDRYIQRMEQLCAERCKEKKFSFFKLTQPPVIGCINWMLENKN